MRRTTIRDLPADPRVRSALQRFLREARAAGGARLGDVVVFGSVARGEARRESDVDVLVQWRGTFWEGLQALVPITTDILLETGIDIAVHPAPEDRFREIPLARTSFHEAVNREGLIVTE